MRNVREEYRRSKAHPHRLAIFVRDWFIPPNFWPLLRLFGKSLFVFLLRSRQVHQERAVVASLPVTRFAKVSDIVWVPLEKVRSWRALAFTVEQHPFVRFFQGDCDALESFAAHSEPKDAMGLVFLESSRGRVGLLGDPPWGQKRPYPWERGNPLDTKHPFPANKTDDDENRETLCGVKASIDKWGFRLLRQNPSPNYLFLYNDEGDGDYRVILADGNHRVSYLAHLGWPQIPMRPAGMKEVRLSELDSAPGVLDGSFTKEEARLVFMAHFRDPHELLLPDWR